jgi:rubrerythrin
MRRYHAGAAAVKAKSIPMANRLAQQLAKLASAYGTAEAEVVRAFFAVPRQKQDHLRWLKAQGFKEYSAIKPILAALTQLYPDIDKGIARHDYTELTEKLADETKHARLVMDLLEEISGKKIKPSDLTWLPQDRKLAKVRAGYSKTYAGFLHGSAKLTSKEMRRKDEELERAAITLTEGGGGALYQVCGLLKKRGIEEKIAAVFRVILQDEMEHKDSGSRSLAALVKNKASFRRAARIICDVSGQRLRMRNEQFGFPLSDAEMKTLDERARQSVDGL